jgi:hypothetical protein
VYLRSTPSADVLKNADTLDAYFNQRLPPSRRYGPYRPLVTTGSKEDALNSSTSAASTGGGSTAMDVEKGTAEPDGAVTDDPVEAAREELAVAEVSLRQKVWRSREASRRRTRYRTTARHYPKRTRGHRRNRSQRIR